MEEKKIFIFGSRWGEDSNLSYYDKNIQKHIVFAGECHSVSAGSYIILKDQGIFKKIGIAKSGVKQAPISELGIFESQEESNKYGISYNTVVEYVEIQKWLEPSNTTILENLIADSYYRSKKGFSPILKSENKKLFNEFLKINNLDEIDLSNSDNNYYLTLENLLTNNYNLILTGAPGTGKTYLAKQIAAKMIFGEDISLDEIEKDKNKKNKFELQYKFVQFHPSYDYTDFVEGIRPATKNDDTYGFKRKDGTFKDFCIKALKNYKSIISENDVREFCEYIKTEIKAMGKFSIKGIGGDNVSPICKIDINDNDVRVEVNTVNHHCFTKTYLELLKLYDNYKDYINSNNQTYQEFVQTYNMPNGQHTYMHGFLHAMYKYFNKSFVFVIDEINRGDINKILGELFYAIDLGYRGEKGKVKTQYQNLVESGDVFENGFYIPENVYIIGTMNDIDRSVESMDFAIRRRFAWYEINPNKTSEEILKNLEIDNYVSKPDEKSYKILEKLNECISGKDENGKVIDKDALGEMYQIGASYFLRLDKYFNKENENKNESIKNAYQKLWDNHLKGLIYEYVRGKKSGNDIFNNIQNKYYSLTGIKDIENNEDIAE